MLTHLTIKNYALIKSLEIEPSGNLNVVTGETGAGKSIMLGALGLLLGNRADTKVLLNEAEKCITEATFDISEYKLNGKFQEYDLDYSPTTVIRREISPSGKSRAFINDTPITLDVMKAIGSKLMEIHSQHETLELGKNKFQLDLIDIYSQNEKVKNDYANTWLDFKSKETHYQTLTSETNRLREESDYVKFQLNELLDLSLQKNELEGLEQELKVGEHAEEIKSKLGLLTGLLAESEPSALSILSESKVIFNSITSFSSTYQTLFERMDSVRLELADIKSELEQASEDVEFNPDQLQAAKDRIDKIYRLFKKHHVNSIEELLKIQEDLYQISFKTDNLDEEIEKAKQSLDKAIKALNTNANQLSDSRKKSIPTISKQLVKLLQELGIPQASIDISYNKVSANASGQDQIEINFSANKGISPRPLAEVASGGEFSRVMFAIKYIMAEKTSLPTLVLDEIDSGVSGEIAVSLGKMMKEMAKNHQLIAISHLPQIAAKADAHYIVFKDERKEKSISLIKKLELEGRVEEIAKMIGGAKPSAIALENARELIASE